MFLSLPIQMRPSQAPIAQRISEPVTDAVPPVPRTEAVMMRPPSPRRIFRKPTIMPIEPVYGESLLVSSAVVNDRCQSSHGFPLVSSPGSHSAFRYGTA